MPSAAPTRRPDLASDLARVLTACEATGDPVRAAAACVQAYERAVRAHAGGPGVVLEEATTRALRRVGDVDVAACWSAVDGTDSERLAEDAMGKGVDVDALRGALIGVESTRHIGLVQHQANKLARNYADYSAEDLFGWGWIGLRSALRSYDPTRFAFSTYACTRIVGAMRDGVRAEQPIPKRLGAELRKLQVLRDHLSDELLRPPTLNELHTAAGIDPERAALLDRCRPTASLDELCQGPDGAWTPSVLGVDGGIESTVEAEALQAAVDAALATIDTDDAQAIRLLVIEGLSVSEAHDLTGASPRQLRQRKTRGLAALAPLLGDWT